VLAAIPQSPTAFDLVRNAQEVCTKNVPEGTDCPAANAQLQVPDTTEVYQRRNYILDLMRTRSPLSGSRHPQQDYADAQREPIVLAPQLSAHWLAPQFVLQVRRQLATILCPETSADQCDRIATGGLRITTTLDWTMQAKTEKWLYAAGRAPNLSNTKQILKSLKIPTRDYSWLQNLRGKNLNNGAAAVMDYRTGEVLAYAGSAGFNARGTKKFQPQWDVLSDGWRQPGSSIKPINYAIGIEDHTMTAATLFMDVTTDFGRRFIPTQADHAERGPVRLREALQFSLNIPSIKAGLMNGLDRFYRRSADFGIRYIPGSAPVTSMSIGTLEVHPIDMISAYGAIADGGKLMPRTMILKVTDTNGTVVWPDPDAKPVKPKQVISPQAAFVVTDILAGNTNPKTNPFWGDWAIYDRGARRPAAYKTGTTNDNKDVHAYGFLAPPKDPKAPALVVGVWMGNSDNSPDSDTLSLGSSAPLWSRILTDVSHGLPMANFQRPKGVVERNIDAITGFLPGPYTSRRIKEVFVAGTEPKQTDDFHRGVEIDAASGGRWQDGCVGPRKVVGALDYSQVDAG
jgi:membrane peptidoglycan carboxypeptidase